MQADREKILDQLNLIIKSEQFQRSSVNVSLLTLLVNSTLDKKELKETIVGSVLFGKTYDPIKNDNKVRVYVHNLRKKLTEYYETIGKDDPIIFKIDKGQYKVSFNVPEKQNFWNTRHQFAISLIALFILAIFAFIAWWTSQKLPDFWIGFRSKKIRTTVLVGDHFTIESQLPTANRGTFRDFSINSEKDFNQYIQDHPEHARTMIPNRYPYITKMGVYSIRSISGFFHQYDLDYDMMLNSEWDKSKINSENLVYIGQFKTMGFLHNIFKSKNPGITIDGNTISISHSETGKTSRYSFSVADRLIDYTIVSRMRGPNGNHIAMFLSDNDIGVIKVIDYYTNPDSLTNFYQRNSITEESFTALYKVSGWERTGFEMELISLEKIDN